MEPDLSMVKPVNRPYQLALTRIRYPHVTTRSYSCQTTGVFFLRGFYVEEPLWISKTDSNAHYLARLDEPTSTSAAIKRARI
jgi:hypothetical protein